MKQYVRNLKSVPGTSMIDPRLLEI